MFASSPRRTSSATREHVGRLSSDLRRANSAIGLLPCCALRVFCALPTADLCAERHCEANECFVSCLWIFGIKAPMDLSLTRVLCAIYEAGSVSRAADALCLSQPPVSHALGRLRREVADPLFVRTATGVVPTP